jgi:hypothetical protein
MQIKLYKSYTQLAKEYYIGKYIIMLNLRPDPFCRKIYSIYRQDKHIFLRFTSTDIDSKKVNHLTYRLDVLQAHVIEGHVRLSSYDYENPDKTIQDN